MEMAKTKARENGWFDVDQVRAGRQAGAVGKQAGRGCESVLFQYENRDNVEAHYKTMGPEIWKQTVSEGET